MKETLFITILVTLVYHISANVVRRDIGTGATDAVVQLPPITTLFVESTGPPQFDDEEAVTEEQTLTNTEYFSQLSDAFADSTLPDAATTAPLHQTSTAAEIFTNFIPSQLDSTQLLQQASSCSSLNCFLPSCRCAGSDIPGGLSKNNTPQIILFTMDDGITPENFQLYSELLDGVNNFNGCPIKATFYVSGDNSDYSLVKKLHEKGHEIADHSATHRMPVEWWSKTATFEDLQTEILNQMQTIQKEVSVTTVGWRTPFLESAENTFKALAKNNFLYDSSLGTFSGTRWWPYTLDYLPSMPCYMSNCPKYAYPGLWEIPLNTLQCDESFSTFSTMVDECKNLLTEETTYNFLMLNFKIFYEDNKQPFPILGHSNWFDNAPYRKMAVARFINDVRNLNDVYFVTMQQTIEWIKSPIGVDKNPFSCNKK